VGREYYQSILAGLVFIFAASVLRFKNPRDGHIERETTRMQYDCLRNVEIQDLVGI